MNDARLHRLVRRRLAKLRCSQLTTAVADCVVTLTGTVFSYPEYVTVGTAVGKLPGVRGVVANMSYPEQIQRPLITGKSRDARTADVVIVGGGVIGCCIARELSRYTLNVVVVEKESDVACGTSKANNGMVHTGIGEKMGTLKQRLCVEGHRHFERLCQELAVPYLQQGLYIALTTASFEALKIPQFIARGIGKRLIPAIILRRAKKLGLPMRKVSRKEILDAEPHLTTNLLSAVYAPTYGVTCPYRFTIALAENATANGVTFMLDTEVLRVLVEDGSVAGIQTSRGTVRAPWIINAAGLYADVIADMAGAREYTIHPKKGAIILFDKEVSNYVHHHLSMLQFPRTEHHKGGGIMITADGNLQWGPTMLEVCSRNDTSVSREEIDTIFAKYQHLLPDFPQSKAIAFFSGLRAATFTEDFVIKPADNIRGFFHVAGIQSPGLAAAPAIANMVIDQLRDAGLTLELNAAFNPLLKGQVVLREQSVEERCHLVDKDPRYGRIVCRCEGISEGEIVDAVNAIIPATTLDAVKRRTRAGMGRCQGGFCLPKVAHLISREGDVPLEAVRKDGDGSEIFIGKAKCLLERDHEN